MVDVLLMVFVIVSVPVVFYVRRGKAGHDPALPWVWLACVFPVVWLVTTLTS